MKKVLILSFVVILLAVSTLPALAKKETYLCGDAPMQPNKRYALAGWVQSIDEGKKQVTVEVAVGNVLAKPCIGEDVILNVNLNVEGEEDTILKYSGGAPMTFYDLIAEYEDAEERLQISSTGFLRVDDEWSALQITLGALLISK